MSEPTILVCALADAPLAVPGSIFNRVCACCLRGVMIAPSGQRKLREMPDLVIICGECWHRSVNAGDEIALAGTREELDDEARRAQPNMRRRRN